MAIYVVPFVEDDKKIFLKTIYINIRLSERDVYKLKACAAKEGLPYQTLVASILHQTASK